MLQIVIFLVSEVKTIVLLHAMLLMRHLLVLLVPCLLKNYTKILASKTITSKSFQLNDQMTNLERSPNLFPILWYEEVTSTMDKAKEISRDTVNNDDMYAVVAQYQSKGRGTRGREWISADNNLFLTIALKRKLLPIPLTLLPLRIGTIIASCVSSRINDGIVQLKWPNDILIDSSKVCGILIEMEGDDIFIGIGCNVMTEPILSTPGQRATTSIAAHNIHLANAVKAATNTEDTTTTMDIIQNQDSTIDKEIHNHQSNKQYESLYTNLKHGDYHKELAIDICNNVYDWFQSQTDLIELVLRDFQNNMDTNPQRLRDNPDVNTNIVIPLKLNQDGTLQVKYAHNETISTLIAEYLW